MALTGRTSPRFRARMAGLCYLLMFLAGALATFGRRGLIITGDAAATATNIMAHQSAYLLGFAGDVLVVATYVAVTALFYRMFKPVSRSVSLTAAFFSLVGCAIQAVACLFELAPLTILGGSHYLSAFNVAQLQSLAYMSLRFYSQTYGIALVFFAFFDLLTGYLIFNSTFLPRILGIFMMLGVSGIAFLWPPFAVKYFQYIVAGAIGEGLLTLWLLAKGVDSERWEEQSRAAKAA